MALASISRPRLRFRYILLLLTALYCTYCFLLGMPLLSSPLPPYSGPFDVGTIDVEAPCEARQFGDNVLWEKGEIALKLETVLFTLFYPSVKGARSRKPKHPWVPKPISIHGEGYARFAHVNNFFTNRLFTAGLWTVAGSTTVPANVDVPLHGTARSYYDYPGEQPIDEYGLPKFPVIIFSHGDASMRTSYTHFCGELASRGYIVAAIEHRDGSGPGTIVHRADGTTRSVFHIGQSDLEPQPEPGELKKMQLAMRQAEVEETVRVLQGIHYGGGEEIYTSNPLQEGTVLMDWHGRLDLDQMIIGGHSFGATLALQALRDAPNEVLPFKGGIIIDPGKSSGPLNDNIHVPIVIIHSQSWSKQHSIFYGRPHFDTVKELTQNIMDKQHKMAWFMTSRNTTHPSVTDAPLIEPFLLSWTTGSTVDAKQGVYSYVRVSERFMQYLADGHRRGPLAEDVSHPLYDQESRRIENQTIADHFQIHVAPSTGCPFPGLCGVESNCKAKDGFGRCVS